MTRGYRQRKIKLAFEQTSLRISLGEIELLRAMPELTRKSPKYGQIAASISEVGIIEPPVVVRVPEGRAIPAARRAYPHRRSESAWRQGCCLPSGDR